MRLAPSRLSKLIGDAAFAVLVVAAFSQFVFTRRIYGEFWQVAATFLIGAVHAVLGVFGNDTSCPRRGARVHFYYLVQCLLVSAALLISPVQGIFFLLAMPLVSETVFDYSWRGSAVITVFLFAVSVGAVWRLWGADGAMQAAAGYFPAFLFTLLTTPGFTDERIHIYMATGLERGETAHEADESLTVETVPLSTALEMIERGDIPDGKTALGILFAAYAGLPA